MDRADAMNRYSRKSERQLSTCVSELQLLFRTVLPFFDHSITEGHRNGDRQNELFRQGLTKAKFPDSRHNLVPSRAVDAAPYPVDWSDRDRFHLFAGYVLGTWEMLKQQGKVTGTLRWGGDWDRDTETKDNNFDDLVHFEWWPD